MKRSGKKQQVGFEKNGLINTWTLSGLIVVTVAMGGLAIYSLLGTSGNDVVQRRNGTSSTGATYESRIGVLPFDARRFEDGILLGEVLVYDTDLQRKFEIYYTADQVMDMTVWEDVLNKVSQDAVLQTEGVWVGLFENTPDQRINQELVNEAREYLENEGSQHVSGVKLAVWFDNRIDELDPATGEVTSRQNDVVSNKAAARILMDRLQFQLNRGEITPEQARDIILADPDVAEMDPSYEANAYFAFEGVGPDHQLVNDPVLEQQIRSLDEGVVSPVLVGRDYDGDWYEAHYDIVILTSKSESGPQSLDEFFEMKKQEGLWLEI